MLVGARCGAKLFIGSRIHHLGYDWLGMHALLMAQRDLLSLLDVWACFNIQGCRLSLLWNFLRSVVMLLSREQLIVLSASLGLILWLSQLLNSRGVPSAAAYTPIVRGCLLLREQVVLVGGWRQLLPPCFILLWRRRLLLLLLLLIHNIRILSICLV